MKTRILVVILVLVLMPAVAVVSLANDGVEMPRWVLGGGASDAITGSGATLRATLGQPVVGLVATAGGEITLGQGFWRGGSLPAGQYHVYLPLVEK